MRLLRRHAGDPPYRALARQVPTSAATLSRLFNGRSLPTLQTVLRTADAMKASPEDRDKCRILWEVAQTKPERHRVTRVAPEPGAARSGPSVVIHDGFLSVEDETLTTARTIVVHADEGSSVPGTTSTSIRVIICLGNACFQPGACGG